tara:strand:+ start:1639 stop:1839 length:201 start_codon:yes stop_codon:yes gene_type:complete
MSTILSKADMNVKLSDAELSIVIKHLLLEIEGLKNELKEISNDRQSSTKTTKRNVPATRVSGKSHS